MSDLTWAYIYTFGGCAAVTAVVVQFTKGIVWIKNIPTQLYSYAVSLVLYNVAALFLNKWNLSDAALSLIAAVGISLASNGAFEGVSKLWPQVQNLWNKLTGTNKVGGD
jgi:hypothetical protein